jgi:hypothetical protein
MAVADPAPVARAVAAAGVRRRSESKDRACRLACAAFALIGAATGRAGAIDDESIRALVGRMSAAPMILEGATGRSYTAWDGSDPSTIRTFTPFHVDIVLKGQLEQRDILLRQPGGEVGGTRAVGAVGAEFEFRERLIVLIGERDPVDGSYDIPARLEGVYRITQDAAGSSGIDVRLGADAGAYSSKEKAPGTLLTRIPVDRFEQLARGAPPHDPGLASSMGSPGPVARPGGIAPSATTDALKDGTSSRLRWLAGLCGVGVALLWWRARRR